MSRGPERGITSRVVRLIRLGEPVSTTRDALAVEEPLEIRMAGEPLAVTMRSPGRDHDLVLGFLFAEGIIGSIADVGTLAHCGRPTEEGYGNVMDVRPAPGTVLSSEALGRSRRGTLTTASCGVCGRRTIEDLVERLEPIPWEEPVPLELVASSTSRLREAQPTFDHTGGVHAAAVLARDGRRLVAAEDVGRHNAVDKVVGALLREGVVGRRRPAGAPRAALLAVSGRVSFEIVQKAGCAGVPIVAGVSAPTALAVDLADRLGMSLVGFVRGGRLNVYTHAERMEGELAPAPVAVEADAACRPEG